MRRDIRPGARAPELRNGRSWRSISTKPTFVDRDPAIDLAGFVKGRYAFTIGDKKLEAEAYGILQVGPTFAINSSGPDKFGPGWNISIAPGFQIFISDAVGLLGELAWSYGQAFFNNPPKVSIALNQGLFRFGVIFRL